MVNQSLIEHEKKLESKEIIIEDKNQMLITFKDKIEELGFIIETKSQALCEAKKEAQTLSEQLEMGHLAFNQMECEYKQCYEMNLEMNQKLRELLEK